MGLEEKEAAGARPGMISPLHLAFSKHLILTVTFKKDLEVLDRSQGHWRNDGKLREKIESMV